MVSYDLMPWAIQVIMENMSRFDRHQEENTTHDDVIKWKHFPRYWPFLWGIYRSPVNSAHKGQWRGALMFALIYAWINGWVNNREAGDLRRHRAHYDVMVLRAWTVCIILVACTTNRHVDCQVACWYWSNIDSSQFNDSNMMLSVYLTLFAWVYNKETNCYVHQRFCYV